MDLISDFYAGYVADVIGATEQGFVSWLQSEKSVTATRNLSTLKEIFWDEYVEELYDAVPPLERT